MNLVLIDSSVWILYFKGKDESQPLNDLIIAQNSIQNDIELYSFDKHFQLMKDLHQLKLFI
jgi:predicted nucleic acid-binding protein